MCGRYYIDDEEDIIQLREIIEEVNRRHNGTEAAEKMKTTGEISPGMYAPILTADGADAMLWGDYFINDRGNKNILLQRTQGESGEESGIPSPQDCCSDLWIL